MPDQPPGDLPNAPAAATHGTARAVGAPPEKLNGLLLAVIMVVSAAAGYGLVRVLARSSTPPAVTPPSLVGSAAPAFSLPDAQAPGSAPLVTLAGLNAKGPVLAIFHRGLQCPHCVEHLQSLGARIADFQTANIQIVAIGPDDLAVARDAIEAYGTFPFPLLMDPTDQTARAYGLLHDANGSTHASIVIDAKGIVRHAGMSSQPVGTPAELLEQCRPAPGQ